MLVHHTYKISGKVASGITVYACICLYLLASNLRNVKFDGAN